MIDIQKIPVTSSNIEAIGYDENSETLRVWFTNNAIYDYEKVPKFEFDSLRLSVSTGAHFAAKIKGKYSFKKL